MVSYFFIRSSLPHETNAREFRWIHAVLNRKYDFWGEIDWKTGSLLALELSNTITQGIAVGSCLSGDI